MMSEKTTSKSFIRTAKRTRRCGPQSRIGCFTCKQRKIKCDEDKPICQRCIRSKIECEGYPEWVIASQTATIVKKQEPLVIHPVDVSEEPLPIFAVDFTSSFDQTDRCCEFFAEERLAGVGVDPMSSSCSKQSDFSISIFEGLLLQDSFVIEAPQGSPVSLNQTILNMINTPPNLHATSSESSPSVYALREEDLGVLSKFQSRTTLTVGTKETVHVLQKEWFRIACQHPMLMHVVLAVTLMHNRYLSGFAEAPQSVTEAYHHYQGTKLFHRALSKPIQPSEKDALWASAALLSVVSFAGIDARTYEEAWPLKAPSVSDLNWLRLSAGKKEVWKLADPMREDSLIRRAWIPQQLEPLRFDPEHNLRSFRTFFELYGLDKDLAGEDNPYYEAASVLMPLLEIECTYSTIAKFWSFIGHMGPNYQRLLTGKDPQALLLLAYWYAKMCQYKQWWNRPRALLECQAICVYLERYCSHDTRIQTLLDFPRAMCGLDHV